MRATLFSLALLLALPLPAPGSGGAPARPGEMARIPAGSYLPLYAARGRGRVRVAAFELDRRPVTRGEYLRFVREDPRWRRGAARPALAGAGYLAGWRSDLDAGGPADLERPVTEVSWHAARAYCQARGKRLPTADEWEYAAAAGETARDVSRDPAFTARLLALYTARRDPRAPVGSTFRNAYGVWDLHGLVWEWVEDFDRGHVHGQNCAGGAVGATDPSNYPAFLRYAFRSGLTGRSTTQNLGFRCARSL